MCPVTQDTLFFAFPDCCWYSIQAGLEHRSNSLVQIQPVNDHTSALFAQTHTQCRRKATWNKQRTLQVLLVCAGFLAHRTVCARSNRSYDPLSYFSGEKIKQSTKNATGATAGKVQACISQLEAIAWSLLRMLSVPCFQLCSYLLAEAFPRVLTRQGRCHYWWWTWYRTSNC